MAQGWGSQGTFQSFGLSSAWPDWPPALGPAWMALVWTYPGPRWLLPHVLRLVFPTGTLSRCPPRRPQDGRDSLPVSRKQIQRFFVSLDLISQSGLSFFTISSFEFKKGVLSQLFKKVLGPRRTAECPGAGDLARQSVCKGHSEEWVAAASLSLETVLRSAPDGAADPG